MSRVPQVVVNPEDSKSIAEHLNRVQRVVDGRLEFGSPQDPNDPASTARALGVAHNGTLLNMEGSWFEAVLTATGRSTVTCVHNLDVATAQPATSPNVGWLEFAVIHDGTGADATSTFTVSKWYQGGTRTANAIDLGFNLATGGTAPTVNADHPVVVRMFFVRMVR